MKISEILESAFNTSYNGSQIKLHFISNTKGVKIGICNFGARITHYEVPVKGQLVDVVLGFDDFKSYLNADELYHGVTVGRFANRIANARFTLDGKLYNLEANNGPNCLHGGSNGFHQQVWDIINADDKSITIHIKMSDLEDGFPGDLDCTVTFTLNDDDELLIEYKASSTKKTVVNFTNHAYFNLNGEGRGDILNHSVKINADQFAPVNTDCIPDNGLISVKNSPFDFLEPKKAGKDIEENHEQLIIGKGYDHAYSLNKTGKELEFAAYAIGDLTGLKLEVYTSEPAMQFYTGNYLSGKDRGKEGNYYQSRYGFCFETQHFPDSPNQEIFPSTVLNPNEVFNSKTIYKIKPI